LPLAQHDILVIADSDIQVGPGYLAGIVGELEKPGVGAVTCLYHGIAGAGFWSRLSALAINTHYLPEVVMALSFRLAQPCFSATIAMRRETLMHIGGFSAFTDCLAEDYSIGEAVRSCGHDVAIPCFSVGHVCVDNSFTDLLAQQMRLLGIIRSIDSLGYAGSIITYPLPLALISALLVGGKAVPLLVIVLGCRIVLSASVARAFRLAPQPYWLIPVQDTISFLAYIGSYFGTAASRRDQRYYALKDDKFVQDRS
jgi:ceramide glucosyltransferase